MNENNLDHEDLYVMIKEQEAISKAHVQQIFELIVGYARHHALSSIIIVDIIHSILLNVLEFNGVTDSHLEEIFERSKHTYKHMRKRREEESGESNGQ